MTWWGLYGGWASLLFSTICFALFFLGQYLANREWTTRAKGHPHTHFCQGRMYVVYTEQEFYERTCLRGGQRCHEDDEGDEEVEERDGV